MTTPQDPFGPPGEQPGQGSPQGDQPSYGSPAGGPPSYGQPEGGWGSPPQGKQGTNGLAIASLITAFLCSPVGIVLGFVAKNQIKQTGQGGDGLATAGIIVGFALIVINVLLFAGGFLAA